MEYHSVVNSKRSLYEWNDPDIGYDTDPPCDVIEGIFQQTKPISSQEKVYVKNSVFGDCHTSDNGGAINCISSDNTEMLIEYTTFYICSAIGQYGGAEGGAIFYEDKGRYIISKCCSIGCNCSSSGQFASLKGTSDEKHICKVLDSSLSFSKSDSVNAVCTISSDSGIFFMKQTNISYTETKNCAAYSSYTVKNKQNSTNSLHYSLLFNTTARGTFTILSAVYDNILQIDHSNFINNTNSYSFIDSYGSIIIEKCSFINNICKTMFTVRNDAILIDCCLPENYSTSGDVKSEVIPKIVNSLTLFISLQQKIVNSYLQ